MTASLPVPHDPSSDEDEGLALPKRGPRALPPPPGTPAGQAPAVGTPAPAGSADGSVAAPRSPASDELAHKKAAAARSQALPRPRKHLAPRTSKRREKEPKTAPAPDPGPPPPLPAGLDGLVIPPVPPLPELDTVALSGALPAEIVVPPKPAAPVAPHSVADAAGGDAAVVESEPLVEPVPAVSSEPVVVAAPVTAAETDPAEELFASMEAATTPRPPPDLVAAPSVFDSDLPAASVDVRTAALSVQGVTKAFGDTRAVDGIDLVVPPGIFYGLVGPNGAGKTTTLSMIAGLLRPDRGSITVGGVDAAAKPRAAKKLMGVLPDRFRTFDRLTGRQLLYYFGVLRGLAPAVVESRAADLARAFDLTDALARPVSDYSAGMTKKVMLAGAMIHSPRLLVLDEPFESVDPVSSAAILDILDAYVAHGGTVILSSHGMDLVERVCSRVAVMVAGQILAEGTIDEVRGELTLEQRFVELAGGLSDVEGLEWLHTFSG